MSHEQKRTFTYKDIPLNTLTAIDLQQSVAAHHTAYPKDIIEAYLIFITSSGDIDERPTGRVEALFFPTWNRLAIAWGADATWADVDDLESGIEMWLNDGDAWKQRN